MIAVIETGGKQYTVSKGQKLVVEKLEAAPGEQIRFSKVLLLKGQQGDIQVGAPTIEGATVVAELIRQTRGDKVIVFKKKRRHNYRRKKGHRQDLSLLQVCHIGLPGEAVPSSFVLEAASVSDYEKKQASEKAKPVAEKPVKKVEAAEAAPAKKKASVSKKASVDETSDAPQKE
ncbi:MAG: 50S ribosomal protein L21 [Alphaproteobacteria bacterium]